MLNATAAELWQKYLYATDDVEAELLYLQYLAALREMPPAETPLARPLFHRAGLAEAGTPRGDICMAVNGGMCDAAHSGRAA